MSATGDPGQTENIEDDTAAGPIALPGADVRFTPGTLLAARYRIVALLGKGGMGEVYRADDVRLGQPVALKFLPPAVASQPGRLDRLVEEVRIGRQVSHPNVCRLYDLVEAEGHHFLVMEFVDGEDLASLLRRIGRLPADKALEIARDLCAGLAAAHDRGVVHRDLKPANVMVDGRGHARIADFGLATLADRAGDADRSGTPAYMAPEQLAGEGGSLRSDVFALGLVLYETFTGRRAYDAKTLAELKAQHTDSKPPSVSSAARDVDPVVERVIQRCLTLDPLERPATARSVLAALPGGDPLEAALIAGETPSPEMVAAAATVGDLRPAAAWAGLVAGLAMLVLAAWVSERRSLIRYVPMTKPADALVARARDVLSRLGYPAPAADSAWGVVVDQDLLQHVARHDRSLARWETLRTAAPGPVRLFYRESPLSLAAESWISVPPWVGVAVLGRVTRTSPPLTAAGMTLVEIDTEGRLARFIAVPPVLDEDDGGGPEVDWSLLLTEAALDPGRLRASTPRWRAPVDTDRKVAWDEVAPARPDMALRVEAASYRGRPVYFEVLRASQRPVGVPGQRPLPMVAAMWLALAVAALMAAGGLMLIRQNLRRGRSDRRGALRIAAFSGLALVAAQLLRAAPTTRPLEEYNLLFLIVAEGCCGGLLVWGFYVALEPALRRRWPHALVAWSRLISGRLRDPMVGRDILVGTLAGIVVSFTSKAGLLVPEWLGRPPLMPNSFVSLVMEDNGVLFAVLLCAALAPAFALSALFIFYALSVLLHRTWLAGLVVALHFAVILMAETDDALVGAAVGAALGGMLVLVLARFGLLALVFLFFTWSVLLRVTQTLDWSMWYAGRSTAVLLLFALVLVTAFHASLGGKPIFGRSILED